MKSIQSVVLLIPILAWTASADPGVKYPFQDASLAVDERVQNLISLMTLPEKVELLSPASGVKRLGVPVMATCEGLHGMAMGGPSNWGQRNPHPTTIFPQAIGMAESWDAELLQRAGGVEGYEVRYMVQSPKLHRGGLVVFAPNADMGRDPRWGRTEECYGEDPYFNGTMAAAYVRGLQGNDPKYWLTASLMKHFFANSNEDGREGSSSDFPMSLFRDYYSVAFRMGFQEGGSRCFMTAYNAWNGIPCIVQPVIRNIVQKEWGVEGIVCTDGGAYGDLMTHHHYFATSNQAAAACVEAGINKFLDNYRGGVERALTNNELTEAQIDEALKGTIRVMIKLGLLDPTNACPYNRIGAGGEPEPWTTEKDRSVARKLTEESIVLLKNAHGLLPLDKRRVKSMALIGRYAAEVVEDWYSGTPAYTNTPLDAIRLEAGSKILVNYARDNEIGAAEILARGADVAVVFVGNHPLGDAPWEKVALPSYGKEAVDRKSITLEDEDLIKAVYHANPRTVVVLVSSFPYAINWTQAHATAILHITHGSEEEGTAIAEALFGDINPAGRLVETWPRSLDQIPPMMDYDIRHGRTYMYFKGKPLYPFGYGLSYTKFAYSDLAVSAPELAADGETTVSFNVKNTGARDGDEVPQLYMRQLTGDASAPRKELRGFRRVSVGAGQTVRVEVALKAKTLARWDDARNAMTVPSGEWELMVGPSSADTRLRKTILIQ